jgi:excisionase family DNA binding protein
MTSSTPDVVLLRPAEVCRMLGVSRSWLYQAAADGRIPHLRLGDSHGPLRFSADDVDAWLVACRQAWRPGDCLTATAERATLLRRPRPAA